MVMVTVIHQRKKCIGCNYCAEIAPDRWRMSKKDGKSTLIGAIEKKEFWIARIPSHELSENLEAAKACPVNIIKIS